MALGKIISIDKEHGYGVIQVDGERQREAFFRSREVIGTTLDALSPGQAVAFGYIDGLGQRGLATLVRLVPTTEAPETPPRA